jgi:hypothetical protein
MDGRLRGCQGVGCVRGSSKNTTKEPSEMTRIRTVGLVALALLAIGACSAASASAALPEFAPFPAPFTAKSGATTLETVKGAQITCVADSGGGEVTGPKTGSIKLVFTGCELVTLALPCNTPGVPPGEIITPSLLMTLDYISIEPKKEVGIDLSTATGGPLMEFMCGALKVTVAGSVIGKITPINKVVKPPAHFVLKFAQAAGKQKPMKFAGGPIDVPMTSFGGPFVESGLASSETLAFPIAMVIAA